MNRIASGHAARASGLRHAGPQILCGAVVTLSAVVYPPEASAASLSVCPVGCPYQSIQTAIDSAAHGDTVVIGKGHYVENLTIVGKRLTLQGADRITTVIDGNGKGSTITIGSALAAVYSPVALSALTITRGFGAAGGGIAVLRGGVLDLQHSIVTSNRSTSNGGGVSVSSDGAVIISDCAINDNSAANSGGGIYVTGEEATATISNSTVSRNTAGSAGGGIALSYDGSHATVSKTSLIENSSALGGGMFMSEGIPLNSFVLSDLTFAGNSSTGDGGGLWVQGSSSRVTHTVFAHNMAVGSGGGIFSAQAARHLTTTQLGGVYIIQNAAGGKGGGVLNQQDLLAPDTVIADNTPDNCVQTASATGCP